MCVTKEKKMTKTYRLVPKDKIEELLRNLQNVITQSPIMMQETGGTKAQETISGPKKGKKIKLANVIYEKVTIPKFRPAQVYELVKDYYSFKSHRYLDAIRTAMKNDARFNSLPDGSYEKAK